MALFDFLKKKKEIEKTKPKVEKVLAAKVSPIVRTVGPKKLGGFSYQIIREQHISEKATILAEQNKYIFKVHKNTNKPEIKKAVEGIYGVNVLDVKVIKIPPKKRRLGRTEGFKKGYSKAVVTVQEGQKIES